MYTGKQPKLFYREKVVTMTCCSKKSGKTHVGIRADELYFLSWTKQNILLLWTITYIFHVLLYFKAYQLKDLY